MSITSSAGNLLPADSRGRLHAAAAAIAAVLLSWGITTEEVGLAVAGVLVAVADLVLAALHARTKVRLALYGVAVAGTVLLTALGYGTEEQWASVLALLFAVLGPAGAASLAPNNEPRDRAVTAGA